MCTELVLAALCAGAVCVAGCAGGAGTWSGSGGGTVLFDFKEGTTGRAHCKVVDDPFGGGGKVVQGELVENDMNKTGFFNDGGFFTTTADWKGSVVLRVAVRKDRRLRVVLVGESGALKSYYPVAPLEGQWCEVVLPLKDLAAKLKAGEKIVDVSIWQLGGGKTAGLYVDSAILRR